MSEEVKQISGLDLSEKQIKEYIAGVYKAGSDRQKSLGEKFSDVDFAMGASVLLFATGNNDKIPAGFVFGPLSGKPIFPEA